MKLTEGRGVLIRRLIEFVALIFITAAAAGVVWASWPTGPLPEPFPSEPVEIAQAPVAGSASAQVVVIEYADFQCPYCAQFWRRTLPGIKERFVATGRIRFVFKHLPLEGIHPLSLGAAEAAECALSQGRFWEIQDKFFATQSQLDRGALIQRASDLGLNQADFQECLGRNDATRVHRDAAEAKTFGITGTPTFFIGHIRLDGRVQVTKRLSGSVGEKEFRAAIDEALGQEGQVSGVMLIILAGGLLGVVGAIAWACRRRAARLATA